MAGLVLPAKNLDLLWKIRKTRRMDQGIFRLFISFVFCFSCKAWADSHSELAHVAGLLLLTPENKELAATVQVRAEQFLKAHTQDLQTKENQDLLKLSTKALNVHRIQNLFSECLNKSKNRENDLGQRILAAARSGEMQRDPCDILHENFGVKVLEKFNVQLKKSSEEQLKNLAIRQSQKNLAQTFVYWEHRIDKGTAVQNMNELCNQISCSEDEKKQLIQVENEVLKQFLPSDRKKSSQSVAEYLNERKKTSLENLKSQDELLLFTSALKDKKSISAIDVIKAQSEVTGLMKDQLKAIRSMDLKELVKTNPAALGQILLNNPEWTPFVCESIHQITNNEESQATWNQVYFWGGLVVGGTLLVTGIGAGVGAVVLSGSAMAGTLTTVATVSAIAGATLGLTDTVYSGGKSYLAAQEAASLRASTISRNGDTKSIQEAQAKVDEAWNELTSAGIGAASVVPFGSLWRAMSKAAQATRAGGVSQIARMTAAEDEAAIRSLSQTIKEITDPDIEKILIKAKSQVTEEEYGSFLGQLSQLAPETRAKILELMKTKPEKVSEAIKKGSKAGAEVCL